MGYEDVRKELGLRGTAPSMDDLARKARGLPSSKSAPTTAATRRERMRRPAAIQRNEERVTMERAERSIAALRMEHETARTMIREVAERRDRASAERMVSSVAQAIKEVVVKSSPAAPVVTVNFPDEIRTVPADVENVVVERDARGLVLRTVSRVLGR